MAGGANWGEIGEILLIEEKIGRDYVLELFCAAGPPVLGHITKDQAKKIAENLLLWSEQGDATEST